jgi:hypothetical protein
VTTDDAHSLGQERTPEGEPIDTHTLWLDFDDGEEGAISLDLTAWNAAIKRTQRATS